MSKPLVPVIVGPTASGKTRLSVELALALGGEIVSADSMQVYRRMNIGTAKPTEEERRGVPHHLIDVVDPSEEYTLKRYLFDADAALRSVLSRGRTPILVGGTGLYVSSLMQNLQLPEEEFDPSYRLRLEEEYDSFGGDVMLARLTEVDPDTAARLFPNDRKRILRALEVAYHTGVTQSEWNRRSRAVASPYTFLPFGLTAERPVLYERIDRRVEQMMRDGLEAEVRALDLPSCSRTARQAIGYRQFLPYFDGEITLDQVVAAIQKESRNYAKRQLTWFRRDPAIRWLAIDRLNFNNILNYCLDHIAKQKEI